MSIPETKAPSTYQARNQMQTYAYTQNGFTAYVTASDGNAARALLENNPYDMTFKMIDENAYVGFSHNKWDFKRVVPLRRLVVSIEIESDINSAVKMPIPETDL